MKNWFRGKIVSSKEEGIAETNDYFDEFTIVL